MNYDNDSELTVEELTAKRDRELDEECDEWFEQLPVVRNYAMSEEYMMEMYRETARITGSVQMIIFFR